MNYFRVLPMIAIIMGISLISKSQTMKFSKDGLNLLPMGVKLEKKFKDALTDIDTLTIAGLLEYSIASGGAEGEGFTFKKISENFKLEEVGADSQVKIYIGYNSSDEVRQIVINCSSCNWLQTKDSLIKIFGMPVVEGSGSLEGVDHESLLFSGEGFRRFFIRYSHLYSVLLSKVIRILEGLRGKI